MADEGTVEVGGVKFSWSVIDGDNPVVTVSHPSYGSVSEASNLPAESVARVLAKELVAQKRGLTYD